MGSWALNLVTLFASAGGGGSSSGGGGGGGGGGGSSSSGGGSGSGVGMIFFLCFFLASAIGGKLYKKYRTVGSLSDWVWSRSYLWIICVVIMIASPIILAIIGPGVLPALVEALLGATFGMFFGATGSYDKAASSFRSVAKNRLAMAASKDKHWDEAYLDKGVRNIYKAYQGDWSNFRLGKCKGYMTERYYNHVELMLSAFQEMHRRNNTIVNSINNVVITNMTDAEDNKQDKFTAGITASLTDQLYDTNSGKLLYEATFDSAERWHFCRSNDSWLLDGITPATATMTVHEQQVQQFATKNGAYYSLDWGRMLLPTRGQLFSHGSLTISDVNNHVIGRLHDTGHIYSDGIIYQIYTYSEQPANDGGKVYLIGQITVPKYYGNILVRRRKGLLQLGVKGLQELQTEWADFNKKYQLFAENAEQVTSFELLNPKMMELLEAQPFEINLEVIDNAIYYYAPLRNITADNYATMLTILQAAYRELKM